MQGSIGSALHLLDLLEGRPSIILRPPAGGVKEVRSQPAGDAPSGQDQRSFFFLLARGLVGGRSSRFESPEHSGRILVVCRVEIGH